MFTINSFCIGDINGFLSRVCAMESREGDKGDTEGKGDKGDKGDKEDTEGKGDKGDKGDKEGEEDSSVSFESKDLEKITKPSKEKVTKVILWIGIAICISTGIFLFFVILLSSVYLVKLMFVKYIFMMMILPALSVIMALLTYICINKSKKMQNENEDSMTNSAAFNSEGQLSDFEQKENKDLSKEIIQSLDESMKKSKKDSNKSLKVEIIDKSQPDIMNTSQSKFNINSIRPRQANINMFGNAGVFFAFSSPWPFVIMAIVLLKYLLNSADKKAVDEYNAAQLRKQRNMKQIL
jgi:uncharacterized membrane protein